MIRLERKLSFKEVFFFIRPLIIGIMICAVLLLPTAYVMLENHQSNNTSINIWSLLIPRFNFESLLYDHYGCGLGYFAWIGLILGLKIKKVRYLSIWLLLLLFIPCFFICFKWFFISQSKDLNTPNPFNNIFNYLCITIF